MIFELEKIDDTPQGIEFKKLYLCTSIDIEELLDTEYLDDFVTYDDGIPANSNDPFLLSYIYGN